MNAYMNGDVFICVWGMGQQPFLAYYTCSTLLSKALCKVDVYYLVWSHFHMCRNWGPEVKFLLQGHAVGMWPSKVRLPGSVLSNSLVPIMPFMSDTWALRKIVILCRMLSWHFILFPCHPWLQHSGECFSAFLKYWSPVSPIPNATTHPFLFAPLQLMTWCYPKLLVCSCSANVQICITLL